MDSSLEVAETSELLLQVVHTAEEEEESAATPHATLHIAPNEDQLSNEPEVTTESNADAIREKYAEWGTEPPSESFPQLPDSDIQMAASHETETAKKRKTKRSKTDETDGEEIGKKRSRTKRKNSPDVNAQEGTKKRSRKGEDEKTRSHKSNANGAKAEEREFRTVYRHTQKLLRREAGSINIQELLVRSKENNANSGSVLMGSPISSFGFPSFSTSTSSQTAASGPTSSPTAAMSALSTLKKHVSELHSSYGTPATSPAASAMGLTDKFLSNVSAQKRNTFQRLLQRDKAMSESYANAAQNSSLLSNGILEQVCEDSSDSSSSYTSCSDSESLSGAEHFNSENSQMGPQHPDSTLVLGGESQVTSGDRETKTVAKRSEHRQRAHPPSLLSSGIELVIDTHPSQSQHSLGESGGWSQHNDLFPNFGSPTTASLGSQSKRLLTLQSEHVSRGGDERESEKTNPLWDTGVLLRENSLVHNGSLSSATLPYDGSSQPAGTKSQYAAEEKEREDEKEKAIISNLVRRHEMWKLRKTQAAASPPTLSSNGSAGVASFPVSGGSDGSDSTHSLVHSSSSTSNFTSRSTESGLVKITQASSNVTMATGSTKPNERVDVSSTTTTSTTTTTTNSINTNTTVFRSLLSSPSVKRSSSFFNLSQDEVGYLRRVNSFESTSARNVVIFSGQSKSTTTTTTSSTSTPSAAAPASSSSNSNSNRKSSSSNKM